MSAYNTEDLSRLEPDYLESYGLHEAPFSNNHQDKFFYIDAERAQGLNLLQHLTHYSNLLLIVQGEQGVGKTAMLQRFIKNAEPDWRICEITANTMMDAEQLLFQAAQGFGVTQLPEDSAQLQEMLYARVATLHHNEQAPILIIDDAHLLPKDALLAIFNLADVFVNDVNLLRIILFSDPLIEKIISSKDIRPLRERITHTMEVSPFDEASTADYLKHRLAVAGFNGGSPFTPKMIKKLYRTSQGVAARINDFAHEILQQGDLQQSVEMPDDVVSITTRPRNHLPIVLASVVVVVVALALVFQDKINTLFEEQASVVDTAGADLQNSQSIDSQKPLAQEQQQAGENPLQERIIALNESAKTTQAESATVQPPVQAGDASQGVTTPATVAEQQADATLAGTNDTAGTIIPADVPSLQLYSLEPDPVPAKNQRQTITVNGQGFTPQSEVIVSWADKQKKLAADQTEIRNDKQIAMSINVGSSEERWSVRINDPVRGQSNILAFQVKLTMIDQGYQRDKWVVTQNPENFTLQLFGTYDKQSADKFIEQHQLRGDVGYFETLRKGKPWYSVVTGSFAEQSAAQAAARKLPASMGKVKPWVRRFDDIQAGINASRKVAVKKKPKPQATTVADRAIAVKGNLNEENNESWLWSQDPRYFTLQLLGARQSDSIQKFLRKYDNLNGKAVYFHTRHDTRDWYAVVYGVYASRQQAQLAIKRLPTELQTASPWIRSFGSIHAELDRTDP